MIFYLITLALICVVSTVLFIVYNKDAGYNKARYFATMLLTAIVLSATGFICLMAGYSQSVGYLIALQCIALGFGYLVAYLLKKDFLGLLQKEDVAKILFIISTCTLAMLGFTLVFARFGNDDLATYYSLSVLPFVLPGFLMFCFSKYIEIPQEIHKIWYFPTNEDEIDFEKIDTNTVYMLEIEYSKSANDERQTNSKARAPLGMKFSDWFRSFIDNYNDRYSDDPIHYLDNDNMPHGWIFYVKPSILGAAKYIDPDLTISENRLSEKNKIMARRVRQE